MKEEKLGTASEIIFHNESNFYTILLFETTEEQFFAVGSMYSPKKGRRYRLTGEWTTHPRYGERVYYTARINWKEDPDWVGKLDKRFTFYKKKHGVGDEIREIVLYSGEESA